MLRPYRVAVERLAIALIVTFIFANLHPHPSLAPWMLLSTASHIQSAKIAEPGISASAIVEQ